MVHQPSFSLTELIKRVYYLSIYVTNYSIYGINCCVTHLYVLKFIERFIFLAFVLNAQQGFTLHTKLCYEGTKTEKFCYLFGRFPQFNFVSFCIKDVYKFTVVNGFDGVHNRYTVLS